MMEGEKELHNKDNHNDKNGVGIRVWSQNMRGLRRQYTRNNFFTMIAQEVNLISFFQETHSVESDNWYVKKKGDLICSHGTDQARGVAIYISNDIEYEIEESVIDTEGRFILLVGTFQGTRLALLNCYAPTKDRQLEQDKFLDKITPYIQLYSHMLIWAGDLNCYLDPKLDKDGRIEEVSKYVKKIHMLMEDFSMCDIWRIRNPKLKQYTWRQNTVGGFSQSRLDYILIPLGYQSLTKKVGIGSSIYSDHNNIFIELDFMMEQKRGRPAWKFNTRLLRDPTYVAKINDVIDKAIKDHSHLDARLAWDTTKMSIRSETISYSAYVAKIKRQHKSEIEKELKDLVIPMQSNPSSDTISLYQTNTRELELLNNEQAKGAQVRARAQHIDENEQNTKYFMNLEKSRAQAKCINALVKDDGTEITDIKQILLEQHRFYKNLYTQPNTVDESEIERASNNFLNKYEHKKLSDEERNELDEEIEDNEIASAIKDMANNKAPGQDGIPVDFYKKNWKKISKPVTDSIHKSIMEGEMSLDQKRATITLIPKPGKDLKLLKNWRPLSLLNCDYKIYAKVMAIRLQTALNKLISPDQSGGIKGRSTYSNIRSTIDIMNFSKENNLPGILASIDYEKAFDTVRWKFIYKVLKTANFGNKFIRNIKTMYNGIQTAISNNGHLTDRFEPTRGIRQGCPISANLFVLIVEILADAIRQNKRIRGIKIKDVEFKITQYADDTMLYLQDQDSLHTVLLMLEKFTTCSGLKINRDKSEAIWIGASSNYRHKPFNLKWTKKSIKSLGVIISVDQDEMVKQNYTDKLLKVEHIIKVWSKRKMTLKGRILIVNSLIVPQMLYVGTVLPCPKWALDKYKLITRAFVWQNKPSKVKYLCLINKLENGGLKLQDIESKLSAIKLKWVKKITDPDYQAPWKSYIASFFKGDSQYIPHYNLDKGDLPKKAIKDKFYKELLHMWTSIHFTKPTDTKDTCCEIIWYNSNIKIDKKTISISNWRRAGILQIHNLLNEQGKFADRIYLMNKYNFVVNFLEYQSVLHAIPKTWKKDIENDTAAKGFTMLPKCVIKADKTKIQLDATATREFYWLLVNKKAKRPISEASWQDSAGLDLTDQEWEGVYMRHKTLTRDSKLIEFNFKITHKILACKQALLIWKIKNNDICDHCNLETDTIEHHLVTCQKLSSFWSSVAKWWKTIAGVTFPCLEHEILFGLQNADKDWFYRRLNHIFLNASYYIYVAKLKEVQPCLFEFLQQLKNRLEYTKFTMTLAGKEDTFNQTWAVIYDNI